MSKNNARPLSKKEKKDEKRRQELLAQKKENAMFSKFASRHRITFDKVIVYFPLAVLLNLVPLYLYTSIFGMELREYLPVFIVVIFFSSAMITLGYHNIAYYMQTRLQNIRESLVTASSIKGSGDKKKAVNRKKRDQAKVTVIESMAFSVLYNNALFLFSVMVLAFFVFGSASSPYNYLVSVGLASAGISFFAALSL